MEKNIAKIDFKKLLREKKYKVTPARLAILSAFGDGCRPERAEDLYKKIKKGGVDFATVYRTLTAFEKSGMIKKVDLRKEAAYYELAGSHHHHIVCTKCDLVEEFENPETERLVKKVAEKSSHFKNISEHSFEFFGLCLSCAQEEV